MAQLEQWYWSLTEHRVVGEGEAKAEDRLGPYATKEEAANALTHVQERNDQWDNDPRYRDEDADDEERTHLDGSPVEE
ncbi:MULTISPECIES: hypothetical protein [unclassified Luteococcus]|uniref:hypothetical protein n=1 Tax=unclassified Luteococcus TaxID=2639923 RepID=UPI00313C0C54